MRSHGERLADLQNVLLRNVKARSAVADVTGPRSCPFASAAFSAVSVLARTAAWTPMMQLAVDLGCRAPVGDLLVHAGRGEARASRRSREPGEPLSVTRGKCQSVAEGIRQEMRQDPPCSEFQVFVSCHRRSDPTGRFRASGFNFLRDLPYDENYSNWNDRAVSRSRDQIS